MSSHTLSDDYERLLYELQTIDFVLVELTLYLDTHPDDNEAIAQFQQFHQRKRTLMRSVESRFGPLQQYGNSPTGSTWQWSEAPWPWQV